VLTKLKNMVIIVVLTLFFLPNFSVKADGVSVEDLLNTALREMTYYNYSIAYERIILESGENQSQMLAKLSAIKDIVCTQEIQDINRRMGEIVSTKSGRAYDDIQAIIDNSKTLNQVDKDYLFYKLNILGKDFVFTEDYKSAVDAIVIAWDDITEQNINVARIAVENVKVESNREYLLNEVARLERSRRIITASIDNTTPTQKSIVNITVNGPIGTTAYLLCHFKGKTVSYSGFIGEDGKTIIQVEVGSAVIGYNVIVEISVVYNGKIYYEGVSFTPVE
jgi:hypothetical protein